MVSLSYNALEILIRSPVFGDREHVLSRSKVNRAMNGTPYSYAAIIKKKMLVMSFEGLDRSKAVELMNFIEQTRGKEITLKDHKNKIWRGQVLNNQPQTTHAGLSRSDFDLIFEGIQIG
jgi:hypothetical protein